MNSQLQRDTVKAGLVSPLAERACVAMAFRILWRNGQDIVWRQILSQRMACDKYIQSLDGTLLILSSITGLVGKSANTPDGKIVNPGLAYWLVLNSANIDPRWIVRQMQEVLKGQAEIKLLQEPPLITTVETMHNTLCTVMKDHNNSYVKRRMVECHTLMNNPSIPNVGFPARLVVQQNDFANIARNAQEFMNAGGVFIDVVQY